MTRQQKSNESSINRNENKLYDHTHENNHKKKIQQERNLSEYRMNITGDNEITVEVLVMKSGLAGHKKQQTWFLCCFLFCYAHVLPLYWCFQMQARSKTSLIRQVGYTGNH